LTFEHIPPRKAFNDRPIVKGGRLFRSHPDEIVRQLVQKGVGEFQGLLGVRARVV